MMAEILSTYWKASGISFTYRSKVEGKCILEDVIETTSPDGKDLAIRRGAKTIKIAL